MDVPERETIASSCLLDENKGSLGDSGGPVALQGVERSSVRQRGARGSFLRRLQFSKCGQLRQAVRGS